MLYIPNDKTKLSLLEIKLICLKSLDTTQDLIKISKEFKTTNERSKTEGTSIL